MDGKRALLIAVTALGLTALTAAPSTAQTYPNRPVKIVVPFAPGGPTEFIIRLIADRLTAMMGQAFVIENRPGGAGGTVGAKSVAVAEADGYTLLFSSPGPLVTAAAVYRNLDYDPIKSFAPIAMVIYAPQMLAVHPTVPANSVQELVAHAKDNPGKITFGSSGHGTQPHMLGEMLKLMAGIILPQLCRAMGLRHVRRYALTGERFDAHEARRLGLVHEVCPAGTLDAAGARIVDALLMNAPAATAATKLRALGVAGAFVDDAALRDLVREHAATRQLDEAAEGLTSFREKRPPSWYPGPA